MKRKANYDAWFWSTYDKSKIEAGLLEAIGHLTFLWNDAEEALDRAVMWAIECPVHMQVQVRSRISGIESKVDIVKAAIRSNDVIPERDKRNLLETMGALASLKEARDAVIHAKASEIFKGIARTFEKRGAVYEVLLTTESVSRVNEHLDLFRKELAALAGTVSGYSEKGRLFTEALARSVAKGAVKDPTIIEAAKATSKYLETNSELRKQRKALRPLPILQQLDRRKSG